MRGKHLGGGRVPTQGSWGGEGPGKRGRGAVAPTQRTRAQTTACGGPTGNGKPACGVMHGQCLTNVHGVPPPPIGNTPRLHHRELVISSTNAGGGGEVAHPFAVHPRKSGLPEPAPGCGGNVHRPTTVVGCGLPLSGSLRSVQGMPVQTNATVNP